MRNHDRNRALVLFLAACGGCAQIGDVQSASKELDTAWNEAIAAGVPTTVADLKLDVVPASDNAAPLLDRAYAVFEAEKTRAGSQVMTRMFEAPTADPSVTASIGRLKPCLDLVRQAATKPAVSRPHDYERGPLEMYPEFAREKTLIKALALSARVSALRGDFRSAASDLKAGRRLARLIGDERVGPIATLVGIACESICLDATDECLTFAKGKTPALRTISDEALQDAGRFDFSKMLRDEAFLGVTTIRNLEAFGGMACLTSFSSGTNADPGCKLPKDSDLKKLDGSGKPKSQTDRAYMARYLQHFSYAMREAQKPGTDLRSLSAELDRRQNSWAVRQKPSYALSAVLVPEFHPIADAIVKVKASYLSEKALAGVLLYQASHGSWPKDLAMAGVNAVDPFDGQPLRYSATENSVRIWSVGPDMSDDGGLSRRENEGSERSDIVASYPHIRARRS
ncbi:MAG: hypothetical protein JST30_12335 [Armatimonadetes bacterium]|nr:hypothetical protein [Armatimonadota bacterium]